MGFEEFKQAVIQDIAEIAHEVNRGYCQSIGDDSQPSWADAPEWQKSSAIDGVNFHINNPDVTPEQSHENWCKQKLDTGWKYGPKKDEKKLEHPCLVLYELLPQNQKTKDYLFRAVVHAAWGLFQRDQQAFEEGLSKDE